MKNKYSLPTNGGLIPDSAPRDIIHRYERINTNIFPTENEGVSYVADLIISSINEYNEYACYRDEWDADRPFVLGLTTGRTPIGLYRELVERYK